jgi:glyoxylase-like metal-dependent hydrolase (beta-lactamase superfamily II)
MGARASTLKLIAALASMSMLTGASAPIAQPQQFAGDVAAALGGRERLQAVSVMVMEGRGRAANLGQDMTWESTVQSFTLNPYRRVLDVSAPRWRTEQTRTPTFLYFQGPQAQRQIVGVDRDVAYSIAANGNATRQSAAVAAERGAEYYHHPISMARALLEPSTAVTAVVMRNGRRTADVRLGETTFAVAVDARNLPVSVSSPSYHPNMGDVTITTSFADYQVVDGLNVPRRLTTAVDGHTTLRLELDRYSFPATSADAAAPDAVRTAATPTAPAPVVQATAVSEGVWLLGGQSHHSALVAFADHLTLIEAPQSEARTRAVIAFARQLVPGKPLTRLVMSHHHFDHSAGLRVAVAEGLAIYTHGANVPFVREMIKRPHSRQPDQLQRNPKPLTVHGVKEALTLRDAAMTMVLYPLAGNPHGDAMLMAYLPGSRVVIQADAYSPGGTYHPYAANLLDTIRAHQLAVDRLVPLHGSIAPFADLVNAATAK